MKSIYFFCVSILISSICFAGHEVSFDPTTGIMKIYLTDGEDIEITKHPKTGGLAINGECSRVLATGIRKLIILCDDGDNVVDLRGMTSDEFPGLVGVDSVGRPRTEVHAAGGDDDIYGHHMGVEVDAGDGYDIIWTGYGFIL